MNRSLTTLRYITGIDLFRKVCSFQNTCSRYCYIKCAINNHKLKYREVKLIYLKQNFSTVHKSQIIGKSLHQPSEVLRRDSKIFFLGLLEVTKKIISTAVRMAYWLFSGLNCASILQPEAQCYPVLTPAKHSHWHALPY